MDLPEPTPRFLAVLAVEVVFYLGGIASLIAWWKQCRKAVGAEARAEIGTLNLALSDLLLAAFTIVVGALLLQSAVGALAQVIPAALSPEAWMVAQGCGFQLGLLSGALLGHRLATASNRDRVTSPSRSPLSTTQACAAGGLLFLASSFAAVGVFASSLTDSQIISFLIAVFSCFFLYMGFDLIASYEAFGGSEGIIRSIGIQEHYMSMSRGVLDLRDALYFGGVIVIFLLLTRAALQSRRW